ncbi:Calmodulin [Mucor velutinosus]|uniref:Calmodulin n=1 Tax=Mucor velutinosus TaxID=708070 RepID=A0AAN7HVQ7_9FUNG|nr:Calmodulin [Mucor velutinosus]
MLWCNTYHCHIWYQQVDIPVTCNASASVYTTTFIPTPGPFGIYTITTTKTETIPLTTTTATTTVTRTITTDGFDLFGQKKTTTLFNTTTVFSNFTTTQTATSFTTIISTKSAATATPTTEYITVTPSQEYVTVISTQSKETVTTTAIPNREYITIISTPSKEYVTITATPNKEFVTITATPSKEYITITANPQTITTTATTTKAAGGLFDGLFGTQITATGAIASSLCSNLVVTVTSEASKDDVTVIASPQSLTTTVTTTQTAGGTFDGIFGMQTTAPDSSVINLFSNTIEGGATKTITLNNTTTRTETSRINVTTTQTFILTEIITTSYPMPPLPTQTTMPSLSMSDSLNVLRVILKVIQTLQGDKPQFNPVLELIKAVIEQAIKQDDDKNVQAALSFVFDLIQKNSSQASINKPFPFTKRLIMKDDFKTQAREWLANQFIDTL